MHHIAYSSKRCRAMLDSGTLPRNTSEVQARLVREAAAHRAASKTAGLPIFIRSLRDFPAAPAARDPGTAPQAAAFVPSTPTGPASNCRVGDVQGGFPPRIQRRPASTRPNLRCPPALHRGPGRGMYIA